MRGAPDGLPYPARTVGERRMTTPRSDPLDTARKRVLTAALLQRNPSPELVRALNRYLRIAKHQLALRARTARRAGLNMELP